MPEDNYTKIINNNLKKIYEGDLKQLEKALPAVRKGEQFLFKAFGEECRICPDSIFLGDEKQNRAVGILLSLYALHVGPATCVLEPFKSFKDFLNSMPYIGAFSTHVEQVLVPHVEKIKSAEKQIKSVLNGGNSPAGIVGDFSFLVYPLPKIALCYIFYEADEDFPASATCLFSNNANVFMPIDGLADVGEYTSQKILNIII